MVTLSLLKSPAPSEFEIESEIGELSSDSQDRNDSDNDSSIDVSGIDLSETEDSDSDSHKFSDLSHRRKMMRERGGISGPSDDGAQYQSLTSRISENKYSAPSLSGLDSISFGALAAAQASLTQDTNDTTTATTTQISHNINRHHWQAPASVSSSAGPEIANSLKKRKRGNDAPSRPSKHAPTAMSSTKPVSRRRVVVSGSEPVSNSNSNIPGFSLASGSLPNLNPALNTSTNQDGDHHQHHNSTNRKARKARDPRFTPLSGNAPTPATLHRRYAFLDEYRAAEAEALRDIISTSATNNNNKNNDKNNNYSNGSSRSMEKKKEKKDSSRVTVAVTEETRAAARAALQKHAALARNRETAVARQELVRAHRRQERELLKQGRKGKAWFLKKGVLRERADAIASHRGDGGGNDGETGIDGLGETITGIGKFNRSDTGRRRGNTSLLTEKREVRKEKKLMRKEKVIMGQRRRGT